MARREIQPLLQVVWRVYEQGTPFFCSRGLGILVLFLSSMLQEWELLKNEAKPVSGPVLLLIISKGVRVYTKVFIYLFI